MFLLNVFRIYFGRADLKPSWWIIFVTIFSSSLVDICLYLEIVPVSNILQTQLLHKKSISSCLWAKAPVYMAIIYFIRVVSEHGFYLAHGHYSDVIMSAMASQITGVSIVCSTICSSADQRKYKSSASLAVVRGIHQWPVDSLTKGQ